MSFNDKEFVQAHWGDGLDPDFSDDSIFFFVEDRGVNFDSWASAAEFTRNRLEEIAKLGSEIHAVERWLTECESEGFLYPVRARILAREQTALAELKRGMR
jgi:hypothetical protein